MLYRLTKDGLVTSQCFDPPLGGRIIKVDLYLYLDVDLEGRKVILRIVFWENSQDPGQSEIITEIIEQELDFKMGPESDPHIEEAFFRSWFKLVGRYLRKLLAPYPHVILPNELVRTPDGKRYFSKLLLLKSSSDEDAIFSRMEAWMGLTG